MHYWHTRLFQRTRPRQVMSVTAPLGGYIKNCLVQEGDYVSVGQPLVSITQNRRLFLRADVSEKYYGYLHSIQSANFRTPYDKLAVSIVHRVVFVDIHRQARSSTRSTKGNFS